MYFWSCLSLSLLRDYKQEQKINMRDIDISIKLWLWYDDILDLHASGVGLT